MTQQQFFRSVLPLPSSSLCVGLLILPFRVAPFWCRSGARNRTRVCKKRTMGWGGPCDPARTKKKKKGLIFNLKFALWTNTEAAVTIRRRTRTGSSPR